MDSVILRLVWSLKVKCMLNQSMNPLEVELGPEGILIFYKLCKNILKININYIYKKLPGIHNYNNLPSKTVFAGTLNSFKSRLGFF